MRTFHAGGIANNTSDITLGLPRVEELFEASVPRQAAQLASRSGTVSTIEKDTGTGRHCIHIVSTTMLQDEYALPEGCVLLVHVGEHVKAGQLLARQPRI